jgi:hypothetical protein
MLINNHNKTENQNTEISNLQSMEKRVKKLTTRLWAGLFLLFIILTAGIIMFANLYYEQIALALDPADYDKDPGDILTAEDWSRLDVDFATAEDLDGFVAKTGDTITGSLVVNGNTTTGGNLVANSNSYGTCGWTGAVEAGCAEGASQLTCPNSRFVAGVRDYGLHNCICMGGDWECSYIKLYCCEL